MNLGIFSINDTIYFRANTVNKQGSAIDATSDPTFSVYQANNVTTPLTTGIMTPITSKTGFYEGSFSTTSFSLGQYFILMEAAVDGQTPSANLTFQLTSDATSLEETFQEVQTIGDSISNLNASVGSGTVSIDHNYGGTDKYRITAHGKPLADVEIRAFVKSDYDAGRKANRYTVGQTTTLTNGRWSTPIRLDPGTYVLEFSKNGYKINSASITVS